MSTDNATDEKPESENPGRVAAMVRRLRNLPQWCRQHRGASAAGAGVLVTLLGVAGWVAIAVSSAGAAEDEEITVAMTLEFLDEGKYSEAREAALQLIDGEPLSPEDFGGPHFVLGVANALEAGASWDQDAKRLHLLAAGYLEASRDRGFPKGREAQGLYHLGRSLYMIGKYTLCRPNLLEALNYDPPQRVEIHRLLAGAYLNDPNPDYDAVLRHNEAFVSATDLPPSDRNVALLQRAQILLRLRRHDESRQVLTRIPADSDLRADALVLEARLIMDQVTPAQAQPQDNSTQPGLNQETLDDPPVNYQAAIDLLREAQNVDTLKTQSTPKSKYLIGKCLLGLGDRKAALEQFKRTIALHHETPSALAVTIEMAQLYSQFALYDSAIEAYRDAIEIAGDPETYRNPWLTLDEFRAHILSAYQEFLDVGEFSRALEITDLLTPLFKHQRQVELAAQCHVAWAIHLMDRAETVPWSQAVELRFQARAQFRRAGTSYRDLAQLHITLARFSDDLWNSAENYLIGYDFDNAVKALTEYLTNETRRRHPRALVSLGEALLSQGNIEKAIEALERCIETYPEDVASFDARRIGSLAYRELGKEEEAEALLLDNLNGGLLGPKSREWKEALFAHGRMLFETGRFVEASRQLEEAVERYPSDPESLVAMYQLGESLRELARVAQELDEKETGLAPDQVSVEARKLLTQAQDNYRQLRSTLTDIETTTELTPVQSTLLRNCYLALADVRFDIQDYEQAVEAYSSAANRYQFSPVALVAYVGIFNCYRRLNRPADARGVVEQAKVVLTRIKDDVPFEAETNYSKKQWQDRLDWLTSL